MLEGYKTIDDCCQHLSPEFLMLAEAISGAPINEYGMTIAEIASKTGMSEPTVFRVIKSGLEKIAKRWELFHPDEKVF